MQDISLRATTRNTMSTEYPADSISPDKLPVIDIARLSSSKLADRLEAAHDIRKACLDNGFFYITGHGVPMGLMDAAKQQTEKLFDLPMSEKMKVSKTLSYCNRGWEPLSQEQLDLTAPPDLKEMFFMGLELPEDHPSVIARRFNHGPNLWPADLPGFRPTFRAYHAAMRDVCETLMLGVALALELPEDYFVSFARDPLSSLRLLHYPPHPASALKGQAGAGAHTDFGAITLLLQDDNGGLQVKGADGRWIEATPIPGTFVFNIGDALGRWTNGIYRSTVHRVVNTSGRERYSMAFFFAGNATHPLQCLPGCLAPGETPTYKTVTVEEHMRESYRAAYAHTEAVTA
jgi:isopenicillin N synthase-like dioxygenase